jgi:hypothetical protein
MGPGWRDAVDLAVDALTRREPLPGLLRPWAASNVLRSSYQPTVDGSE